jgi:hypothetical protein
LSNGTVVVSTDLVGTTVGDPVSEGDVFDAVGPALVGPVDVSPVGLGLGLSALDWVLGADPVVDETGVPLT